MIFGDKINQSFSENDISKNMEKNPGQLEPFSFSALHFLRNRLLPADISQCYNFPPQSSSFSNQPLPPLETILPLTKLHSKFSTNSSYSSAPSPIPLKSPATSPKSTVTTPTMFCSNFLRRPRGEKRPIPEEQKDEKYFERRKRNNEAAKKSRDARKMREDRIALRAALLEQENSILRAQTIALREEVCTLRQILCNSRALTSGIAAVSQT